MSRNADPSSGPELDDTSEIVDYENDAELRSISEDERNDSDNDIDTRRRRKQPASISSKQVNHIKQSASNARAAASTAASNSSSSASNTAESNDLRLITLIKRYERKVNELSKRESEIAEREKSSSSKSSKRRRSSNSRKRSSDTSEDSNSEVTSDRGDASDNSDNDNRRRNSSSNGLDGKEYTLRQHAMLNKFENLQYVDISVFSRANLNVRKSKKLVPLKSSAEYSAAWASLNVELQQYLISANRGEDALMVSKYYSQIVRLLTDYSSQWQLVMELDEYIRGDAFTVNDHIVWSIDRDDDHVSRFKYDIQFKHQDASRAAPTYTTSQRGAHSNARRSGGNASNSNASSKPRNVCYAYNGLNSSTNEWTTSSHCLGAERCKFSHRCMHCHMEGHAIYERAECNAHPRARTAPRQPSRRA
jgi:hypothetical protein